MQVLSREDIHDVLSGCTILGSGGGGALSQGLAMIDYVLDRGAEVRLVDIDEIVDDALAGCPYMCGAVSVEVEQQVPSFMAAALDAYRAIEQHASAALDVAIATELGGMNTAVALAAAAMANCPTVDGDPAGRAVPELQQTTFAIQGLPITPIAVGDGEGGSILISTVSSDLMAEKAVRGLAAQSPFGAVGVVDHLARFSELRHALLPRTLTDALRIGRSCVAARLAQRDVANLVAEWGGLLAFRGTVSDVSESSRGGFTFGEIVIRGTGAFNGSVCRVWSKNENLAAWRDDVPIISVPDIICVFDEVNYTAVVNPACEVGCSVSVVGLPSPEVWTTSRGLELFGPRSFGLEFDYFALHRS
jgi:uncharacterized protein